MKPAATMSRTQIKAEMKSNSTKQSKLNDKLIADGFGSFHNSQLIEKHIPEAIEKNALQDRYCDLKAEEECIYLGYRKSTPTKAVA